MITMGTTKVKIGLDLLFIGEDVGTRFQMLGAGAPYNAKLRAVISFLAEKEFHGPDSQGGIKVPEVQCEQ